MSAKKTERKVDFLKFTTDPYAECQKEGCGWRSTSTFSRLMTMADCSAHVRETGHTVVWVHETVVKFYLET